MNLELTDLEKAHLRRFWDNQEMRDAVKKVLLAELASDVNIGLGSGILTNEAIGELIRGKYQGLVALETAFATISQYQSLPDPKVVSNQAR